MQFPAVIDAGVKFVGVKATEGVTFTDPRLLFHRAGLRTQPLNLVVYYHYGTSGDPRRQADHIMDTIGPLRDNERLVLDLEGEDVSDLPAAPDAILAWLDGFYTELLASACSDRRPFIYTSKRIWDMFGNPAWDLASEVDLWTPRYGPHEPELPAPWTAWTIWQFSQTYTINGVSGPCDANWFAGDESALREYVKPPSSMAPDVVA